ncbi:MAG: M1 family metallopeptidase [Chitinophagales bacterium]|nr:M1 family metallopeptidase [Chitinophagales bacterium]
MKSLFFSTIISFLILSSAIAQSPLNQQSKFNRGDTLRGMLSPERSGYDVTYYHLNLKVDPSDKTISGYNDIHFTSLRNSNLIQIDLFKNMIIDSIMYNGSAIKYSRSYNAVFIDFREILYDGKAYMIRVYYHGKPIIANRPPWDGGFTWNKDDNGKDWIGVSCEGIGASLWWPNKDHLSDEPDSMSVTCTVPDEVTFVGNGNLKGEELIENGWKTSTWHVSYPINNYNVTLNIGDYRHLADEYVSKDDDRLALDYYVLPYNVEKAKTHFEQVKPMLACYEDYLGKFPFWQDGFALVETPYLGMEHQGAIAYGNQYKTGYAGFDFSRIGLEFDYIIIHEAGHEYWGNNVSAKDIADLWIHEGFCTYTEAIYVECMHGYDVAMDYVNAKKPSIGNENPMIGIYNVNKEGDGDMYNKGMLFLNSVRHIINDDELWFGMLRDMQQKSFKYKTTSTEEILAYFNEKTEKDWSLIFEQYLNYPSIPKLEVEKTKKGKNYEVKLRWLTDVENFEMPIFISTSKDLMEWVNVGNEWTIMEFKGKEKHFKIDEEIVYFTM